MKLQEYRMRNNEGTNKYSHYGVKKKKKKKNIRKFTVKNQYHSTSHKRRKSHTQCQG